MRSTDQHLIGLNYNLLVKQIPTEQVLSHLYQVGVLTKKDCNTVLKSKKSNRVILYLLKRRGSQAFSEFLKSLPHQVVIQMKTLENQMSNLKI